MFNFPIPQNIKNLKTKYIYIGCFGNCPIIQYISRIDCKNTHGWQCRFLKPSTFFNDDDYGGILEALEEAVLFLSSIYKPRPIKIQTKERANKKIPLGILGIGVSKKTRKTIIKEKGAEELYITVFAIKKGQSPKRIYVGTNKTATPERMDAALKKAIGIRRRMQLESLFL